VRLRFHLHGGSRQVKDPTMHSKRRYAFGIGLTAAAAVASTLALSLAPASAQPGLRCHCGGATTTTTTAATTTTTRPPKVSGGRHASDLPLEFDINRKRPVAGKTFSGLTITLLGPGTINWVNCDAKIADTRLRARQQSFFAGSHERKRVICRWRIPPQTGGERLRLWNYGHHPTFLAHISPQSVVIGRAEKGTFWVVKWR
jgi:hypothetical protein